MNHRHVGICFALVFLLIGASCQPSFEALSVDPETVAFAAIGETETLAVFGLTSAEALTPITLPSLEIVFTSSAEGVATVTESGVVTAVGAGDAIITATADYGSADVAVTVSVQQARAVSTSPADGEAGVAVTRETILTFDVAIDRNSITSDSISVSADGARITARIEINSTGRKVTLFYGLLPGDATITVTVDGDQITTGGTPFDADDDGNPGGQLMFSFRTANLTPVPGTTACGRVFASEVSDGGTNVPLAGVTITVDGAEDTLNAATGTDGRFCLEDMPAGLVFVHINGSTATDPPSGYYYPFVGKMWKLEAGVKTHIGILHLPAIAEEALIAVSNTADTQITFADEQLDMVTDPELLAALVDVQITVPADSLFADDGTRGGMVGIAPVAADRLPGVLPPGLEPPIVITVQTDGPTNFSEPLAACFPNLPDPVTGEVLEPGDKSALWSFNHDVGRFEVVGAMTVGEDGKLICTDEGVGIPAPGWHTFFGGSTGSSSPLGGRPPPLTPPCPAIDPDIIQLGRAAATCLGALGNFGEWVEAIDNITSEVQNLSDLREQFTDAFMRYGSGDAEGAEVLLIIAEVEVAKTVINELVAAAASTESPISKAIDLMECGEALLTLAEDACVQLRGTPSRCRDTRPLLVEACDKRPRLAEALEFSRQVLEAVNEEISAIATTAVCRAIDAAREILLRGASATGREATQAVDEELLAALGELDTLLDPLVVITEEESAALDEWLSLFAELTDLSADVYLLNEGLAPNAFVLLEYGRATQRFKAEASGFYRAVLTAETFYKLSIYDPALDQCGANLGESAAIGAPTDFHSPALQACAAGDLDGDGLSDAAEYIIGTSLEDPDTDGDGIDDFTEVQAGTDPGGGSLIRFGEIIDGDLATAGDIDVLLVAAVAGESVFLDMLSATIDSGIDMPLNWFAPDGTPFVSSSARLNNPADRADRRVDFEESGVYTLTISLSSPGSTGSYRLRIMQPTVERRSFVLGVPISGAIEIPGDIDEWTFSAEAGTEIFLDSVSVRSGGDVVSIAQLFAPSGDLLTLLVNTDETLQDFGPITLTESGDFTLQVGDGITDDTYSYVFSVGHPEIAASRDIAFGEVISSALEGAGGFDEYRFDILAGQRIFLDILEIDGDIRDPLEIDLLAPDGSVVFTKASSVGFVDFGDRGPVELEASGEYRLFFRAPAEAVTYSFQVVQPTVEVNALTLGSPITGTIDTAGDIDGWEFEGLAGQLLSFDFLDVDIDAFLNPIVVNLVAPGGDVIATTSGDGLLFINADLADSELVVAFDEDGTYTLLIRGQTDSDILFSYEFMLTIE